MLPQELKELIDRYCMGVKPTNDQMDRIMDLTLALDANPLEVDQYMKEVEAGPTREQIETEKRRKQQEQLVTERRKQAEGERKRQEEELRFEEQSRRDRIRREREEKENAEKEGKRKLLLAATIIISFAVGIYTCWLSSGDIDTENETINSKTSNKEFSISDTRNKIQTIIGSDFKVVLSETDIRDGYQYSLQLIDNNSKSMEFYIGIKKEGEEKRVTIDRQANGPQNIENVFNLHVHEIATLFL